MKPTSKLSFCLALGLTLAAGQLATRADTIFNNSTNDQHVRFQPGTLEVGDEIILAGSARYLTNMSFEYWGTTYGTNGAANFAGLVQADVKFYLNDGTNFNGYPTPGTRFFDSGWFDGLVPTSRSTVDFVSGLDFASSGLFIPATSNLTWTVQFRGMGAGDALGVDVYSPPVVGGDYADYWECDPASWQLRTNSITANMDFATVWQASQQPVPEPAAGALLLMGCGLVGATAGWVKRKQK
ncbi:MAG: hypothetical protein C5B50_28175 [Verrucomicrobia bacterium]|nr:MAG: hypothetical protein C5B50_28175 [Verrucomicrobiota bacterium]